MMSVESFAKLLRPRVEARTPFIAYWHLKGFSVLNTGEYTTDEYDVMIGEPGQTQKRHALSDADRDYIILAARRKGERIDCVKTVKKRRKTKASTVNKMRKILAGLEKDPRIISLYAIEFDGTNLAVQGPDVDFVSSMLIAAKSVT